MGTWLGLGGKIDAEGGLKFLLHLFKQGYSYGWNVAQRGAGANMSVDIAVGGGQIATSANVPYYGWSDAITNVVITTSSPSNPRIDTVVAYVNLSAISSASTNNPSALVFLAVAGTPAASPTAPSGATIQTAVGAGNPYVILANVAVGTSVSTIVTANITDLRPPMAFAGGYLWGGASNTKGHLVPNAVDKTLGLVAAATGQISHTDLDVYAAWQSWTPTWTASTTNPVLNNGTIVAKYQQIGKTVFFRIVVTMGSTTTFGTGSYRFTLPTTANEAAVALQIPMGQWGAAIGANNYAGLLDLVTSTTIGGLIPSITVAAQSGGELTNISPGTFVSGSTLSFKGFYETV